MNWRPFLLSLVLPSLFPGFSFAEEDAYPWPGFRGDGSSHARSADKLPQTWSDSKNVAWRVPLAGYGQSSPVVGEGLVFVTSTGGERKERLFVEAFHLRDGSPAWKQEFVATQKAAEVSNMISRGAPTPVVDEAGVHVFFESGDLVSLSAGDGEVRWARKLTEEYGPFVGGHGIGTSPVRAPGALVLLIDHEGPSYLLKIDHETGKNLWRVEREPRVSWSTPLVLSESGEDGLVVVSSNGVLEGFDLSSGDRLWWLDGLEGNTVASPSALEDLIVIGASAPQNTLALRLGPSGKLSRDQIAWQAESVTSSFGSPLLAGDSAYFVNRAGALQCTDLEDGSLRWERRLPDSCWASPIAADGLLWFFGKNGQSAILSPGADGAEVVSENPLTVPDGDRIYGVAVAGDTLIFRSGQELIAVRQDP